MKNCILYFTGSGNSLAIAKKMAERLDDCQLLSVASIVKSGTIVEAEQIGLVFPVYMHRAPKIVIKALSLLKTDYCYAIATNGGGMGIVFKQVKGVGKKHGVILHAGFALRMPDNYTPFGAPPEEEEQRELFTACDEKLQFIEECVQKSASHFDNETSFFNKYIWPGPFYALGYAMIARMDSGYWVQESCGGCGICARVCPVENITIADGKPQWNGSCEQCFACVHWCPSSSVEFGKKTAGVARYRHPDITLDDMYKQLP